MITRDLLLEYDVILASASPRRKELISLICDSFRVIPADCDEAVAEDIPTEKIAEYLSDVKCRCIGEVYGSSLVIGCDTVVICDGKVMGKPADKAEAAAMLRTLSGRSHLVITGVTFGYNKKYMSFSCETKVTFRELSEEDISAYISTDEPMDKAGAYGIQGQGALLAEKIEGDFYNVVGFPVSEINVKIKEFLEGDQSK